MEAMTDDPSDINTSRDPMSVDHVTVRSDSVFMDMENETIAPTAEEWRKCQLETISLGERIQSFLEERHSTFLKDLFCLETSATLRVDEYQPHDLNKTLAKSPSWTSWQAARTLTRQDQQWVHAESIPNETMEVDDELDHVNPFLSIHFAVQPGPSSHGPWATKELTLNTPVPDPTFRQQDRYSFALQIKHLPLVHYLGSATKALSTQDWLVAKEESRANKILQSIEHLKERRLWSARQLKRFRAPPRQKCLWDYLLEEMEWMSVDFKEERKWKIAAAYECAHAAKRFIEESNSRKRLIPLEDSAVPNMDGHIEKKQFIGEASLCYSSKEAFSSGAILSSTDQQMYGPPNLLDRDYINRWDKLSVIPLNRALYESRKLLRDTRRSRPQQQHLKSQTSTAIRHTKLSDTPMLFTKHEPSVLPHAPPSSMTPTFFLSVTGGGDPATPAVPTPSSDWLAEEDDALLTRSRGLQFNWALMADYLNTVVHRKARRDASSCYQRYLILSGSEKEANGTEVKETKDVDNTTATGTNEVKDSQSAVVADSEKMVTSAPSNETSKEEVVSSTTAPATLPASVVAPVSTSNHAAISKNQRWRLVKNEQKKRQAQHLATFEAMKKAMAKARPPGKSTSKKITLVVHPSHENAIKKANIERLMTPMELAQLRIQRAREMSENALMHRTLGSLTRPSPAQLAAMQQQQQQHPLTPAMRQQMMAAAALNNSARPPSTANPGLPRMSPPMSATSATPMTPQQQQQMAAMQQQMAAMQRAQMARPAGPQIGVPRITGTNTAAAPNLTPLMPASNALARPPASGGNVANARPNSSPNATAVTHQQIAAQLAAMQQQQPPIANAVAAQPRPPAASRNVPTPVPPTAAPATLAPPANPPTATVTSPPKAKKSRASKTPPRGNSAAP